MFAESNPYNEPFYVKCIEVPKSVKVLKAVFMPSYDGLVLDNDHTQVTCLMNFDSNRRACQIINRHIDNYEEVLLQVYPDGLTKLETEFPVLSAQVREQTGQNIELLELTIHVPKKEITTFFPKTTNDELSIFESRILTSGN